MAGFKFSRLDVIPAIVWIVLGTLFTIESYMLDIGSFNNPGSSMMPFLLGIIAVILSLALLLSSLANLNKEEAKVWVGVDFWRVGLAVLTITGFGVLLETVGFSVDVAICLFLLYKIIGNVQTFRAVIYAILTALLSYLLFVVVLNVQLPSFPSYVFFE